MLEAMLWQRLRARQLRPRHPWILIALTAAALTSILAGNAQATEEFAGSGACTECHAREYKAWRDSHHGWALRQATEGNALGDFGGATLSNEGITSKFTTREDGYHIQTDGEDGKLKDYAIRFTVGVWPLQQYVVETNNGRLQVLDTAWDAIRKSWYHLYPDADVAAGNGLHWTGSYKNWQARCGECHQTGFVKNYDPVRHSYSTSWAELTVSCESCHGGRVEHLAWARNRVDGSADTEPEPSVKLGARQQAGELAVCGPCHSRREAFSGDSAPAGSVFGDHYNLALLTPGLYFADGQQQDEVYVLGSFLQSKMKAKGVTCSNCHDPHSGQLIAIGNAICTQCHSEAGRTEFPSLRKASYDTAAHHHHKPGTDAARCVSCHMPERTYMRIDKRRDHFFRMPDPAQSKAAGAPDACTSCHAGETQDWAAQQIDAWFPTADRSWQDRSAFIALANGETSEAEVQALADYALDPGRPDNVRASALDLVRDFADEALVGRLQALLADRSDLLRGTAATLARNLAAPIRIQLLTPLLADPVRAVRQAAASELLADDTSAMTTDARVAFDRAVAEYRASRVAMADTPEAQMALAGSELATHNWTAAETAFKDAAAMDPQIESAWLTLSQLRAALGDQQGALRYLQDGLQHLPTSISLMLAVAAQEGSTGNYGEAMQWYRRVLATDDAQRDALAGLGITALQTGEFDLAIEATRKLLSLEPSNAQAYAVIAIAYYAKGDLVQAKANAVRAREIDPTIRLPPELDRLAGGG
jgi:tetratricopeptide (TPR) repeat protein